jgi:hypothetical protein
MMRNECQFNKLKHITWFKTSWAPWFRFITFSQTLKRVYVLKQRTMTGVSPVLNQTHIRCNVYLCIEYRHPLTQNHRIPPPPPHTHTQAHTFVSKSLVPAKYFNWNYHKLIFRSGSGNFVRILSCKFRTDMHYLGLNRLKKFI